MSVSKVILLGHLGDKPTAKVTNTGKDYCYFSLATNKKLKNGEKITQWHFITAWGQTADICVKYLQKGSKVFIEGELRYREIETSEGKKAQTASIVVNNIQFINTKSNNEDYDGNKSYKNVQEVYDNAYSSHNFTNSPMTYENTDELPF